MGLPQFGLHAFGKSRRNPTNKRILHRRAGQDMALSCAANPPDQPVIWFGDVRTGRLLFLCRNAESQLVQENQSTPIERAPAFCQVVLPLWTPFLRQTMFVCWGVAHLAMHARPQPLTWGCKPLIPERPSNQPRDSKLKC